MHRKAEGAHPPPECQEGVGIVHGCLASALMGESFHDHATVLCRHALWDVPSSYVPRPAAQ